jgi:RNA polymerase sigma factor (sigma-70 family)
MSTQPKREQQDQDLVRLYLDDIGKYPLLTKKDEIRLSALVRAGLTAKQQLARPNRMTFERRQRLQHTVCQGEQAARQFVEANLRLVVSVARRYQSPDMPLLDLIQEGNMGLIHAVDKFDGRKGFKFSTYATWWIKQAITRSIEKTGRTIRLPVHVQDQIRQIQITQRNLETDLNRRPSMEEIARQLNITPKQVTDLLRLVRDPVSLDFLVGLDSDTELGELIADTSTPGPAEVATRTAIAAEINRLLCKLDQREQKILRLRYGLEGGQCHTLDQIGTALNLTRERIRQIEISALAKMRHPSGSGPNLQDLLAS